MRRILVLGLIASCDAFALGRVPITKQQRTTVATASLLDNIIKGLSDTISKPDEQSIDPLSNLKDERTARASHILLSFEQYPDDAEDGVTGPAMANGLKAKIEQGDLAFELVAEKFSQCSSREQGGDLGTFKRGAMVKEFDDVVFGDGELGAVLGPVRTKFGHHLIKVMERSA